RNTPASNLAVHPVRNAGLRRLLSSRLPIDAPMRRDGAACERAAAREAAPRLGNRIALRNSSVASRALAPFALRGGGVLIPRDSREGNRTGKAGT
ncbi:hypothetical protein, partial [Mesorhizobium sp.]|uniref:hypothetical protein n=1 Tax=Mesorhizobium sp. TaxID=1871066 RepID=UPI0025C42219